MMPKSLDELFLKAGEAYYIPCPRTSQKLKRSSRFLPGFENEKITWIGQNLKYDMLVFEMVWP